MEDANFTYQYDNNGNQIRKTAKIGGAVTTYEYDAENKLVRVISPTNTANYKYDGLGRRVEKEVIAGTTTVTKYVYDNEDILLELNGANAIVARYTHGPGIDEPLIMEKSGQSFYYHADGLSSITEMTTQSGTVAQRYTYSSFGKIESQLDATFLQPYTYTARELDRETGLYFYRARHYDSATGRFLQPDPIGFAGGDLNLQTYVGGNPILYLDPEGLDATVSLYPGASGFGHVGIGVNNPNTTGFYPAPGASLLSVATGQPVPGVMHPDTRIPIATITIPTTPQQDRAIQDLINQRTQNPGNYDLNARNCTTTVRDALTAGGVSTPATILPRTLMRNLQRQFPQEY